MFLRILIACTCVFWTISICAQQNSVENLFVQAEKLIAEKKQRTEEKQAEINKTIDSLRAVRKNELYEKQFLLELKASNAYAAFVQDSAYHYALLANQTAYRLGRNDLIDITRTKIARQLLLKGFFKEAIDSLAKITPKQLNKSDRMEFYYVFYRAYFDIAVSRHSHFGERYKQLGKRICSKLWQEADSASYDFLMAKALNNLAWGRIPNAIAAYRQMISSLPLDHHQAAMCHFGLGVSYGSLGEGNLQKEHLLKSIVHDLQGVIKETAASRMLAEQLLQEGDINRAYLFIQNAKEDADFYNSDLRKLDVAHVLPKIEMERFKKIEAAKTQANIISVVVGGFCMVIIYLSIIFYRQVKKLRKARKTIMKTNSDLEKRNEQLREANKIKEEYIGYYFNFSTEYIDRLEALKKSILQKIMAKRFEAIDSEMKNLDINKERELLFEHFDQIFLKLFPNFVVQFNQLFDQEHRVLLKKPNSLNTDLRIFALIRLGITNSEKIASVLSLSVNTIYTYKTKVKKRSFVPNDEFEKRIMAISFL